MNCLARAKMLEMYILLLDRLFGQICLLLVFTTREGIIQSYETIQTIRLRAKMAKGLAGD